MFVAGGVGFVVGVEVGEIEGDMPRDKGGKRAKERTERLWERRKGEEVELYGSVYVVFEWYVCLPCKCCMIIFDDGLIWVLRW